MKSEILFISRNYPPQIGGLETYSYNLIKYVGQTHPVCKIVLSKPKKHLFWFIPYALFRAVRLIKKGNLARVHLCDGLLAPLGLLLKLFLPITVSATIHGLDITFRNWLYQKTIPRCVSRLDKVICVSRNTQKECINRGIPAAKTCVIPNGINPAEFRVSQSRGDTIVELAKSLDIPLEGKKILLTVGRLVHRKGVPWFISKVMPRLDDSYVYLIVGDGPEFSNASALVGELNLKDRVFLLGRVSEEMRNRVLYASDMFIMPNVSVDGDVEGFGIAALEAGCCGTPVIASDLEGLGDAVLHGRTGFLVESGAAEGFLKRIKGMELDRDSIRSCVVEAFDWEGVYLRYEEVLDLHSSQLQ